MKITEKDSGESIKDKYLSSVDNNKKVIEENKKKENEEKINKFNEEEEKLMDLFLVACKKRDINEIEKLLIKGAYPNYGLNNEDLNAIHCIFFDKNGKNLDYEKQDEIFNCLKILFKTNYKYVIKINSKDRRNGRSILFYACSFDNYEMVKFILMNGIDTNIIDNDGKTALNYLVTLIDDKDNYKGKNGYEIIESLLEYGTNPTIKDNKG